MNKKLVIGGIVLLLSVGGGGFVVWQNGKDMRELNKNLPEGVSVTKSLFGNNYEVVNKIDGYEFRVPQEWRGVDAVNYTPEREEEGFKGVSIFIRGKEGEARTISVDTFYVNEVENLKQWAQSFFDTFSFTGSLEEQKISDGLTVVRAAENPSFGPYMYFVKIDSQIHIFTGGSEEFIRKIITNGKW